MMRRFNVIMFMEVMASVKSSLNEYWRDNKCFGCKYYDTCYGITDFRVRQSCTHKKTDGGRAYVQEAPRWGEMSYHRFKGCSFESKRH